MSLKNNIRNILIILSIALTLSCVFFFPRNEDATSVYSEDKLPSKIIERIGFEDVTEQWGLVFDHNSNIALGNFDSKLLFPSVLLYDFDRNGHVDILFTGGSDLFLFQNMGDGKFFEISERVGLSRNVFSNQFISQAISADFNSDGEDDLLFTSASKHFLFLKKHGEFKYQNFSDRLGGYTSFAHGVNVLDFNQDGKLDIIFANFITLGQKYRRYRFPINDTSSENRGALNSLLIQGDNLTFSELNGLRFKIKAYSNSVGISDINQDGFPDFVFANDYGPDYLFMNNAGAAFSFTPDQIQKSDSSLFGGKGVEFADYNQDGQIDLFITNTYAPPFQNGYNLLWEKNQSGKFLQLPVSNVGKCGMSWAAKFSDFNLDGEMDVFMVNGHNNIPKSLNKKRIISTLYRRAEYFSYPFFLFEKLKGSTATPFLEKSLANERDCLFIQSGGQFYDVAKDIGLNDIQAGRGMGIADLNNDGLMDIVSTNIFGKSKVYINKSKAVSSWIGFVLHNKHGSLLPIGSLIKLRQSNGPELVREYYPANGFRGQSDHRIHFGLKPNSHPISLTVKWANGSEKSYKSFKLNSYNEIFE